MRNMYSRYRPHRRELEPGGRRVRRPPGDIPGSRTFPGTAADRFEGETVKQILSLDCHELFTQLVAQSNLVKIGPRNGLFTCFVEVEEGVIRVWKEWLREMVAKNSGSDIVSRHEVVEGEDETKEVIEEGPYDRRDLEDERILWVSPAKNSGLRFNIRERKLRRDAPILIRADEDMPVSYEIEYDGKSSTIHLLSFLLICRHRTPRPNLTSSSYARKVSSARG